MLPFRPIEIIPDAEHLLPFAVETALKQDLPYGGSIDLFTQNAWDTPAPLTHLDAAETSAWPSATRARLSYMATQASRLQPVNEGDETDELPDMQVCIPLAIAKEKAVTDAESVIRLLGRASTSLQVTDVLLWANASSLHEAAAEDGYEALRERMQTYSDGNLRISTAYTISKIANPMMSRIRHDMMAGITFRNLMKENAFRLPILWLDDDVTYLSNGALGRMRDRLHDEDAPPFAHFDLDHSVDWVTDEADAATKAVILNELLVRKEKKMTYGKGYDYSYGYDEESGLGFMLGSYWLAHGVSLDRPYGEAPSLIDGYNHHVQTNEMEYHIAKKIGEPNCDRVPDSRTIQYMFGDARMTTSDRRTYELVRRHGITGLQSRHLSSMSGYQLYSHMDKVEPSESNPSGLQPDEVAAYFSARIGNLLPEDRRMVEQTYRRLYGQELSV